MKKLGFSSQLKRSLLIKYNLINKFLGFLIFLIFILYFVLFFYLHAEKKHCLVGGLKNQKYLNILPFNLFFTKSKYMYK